MTINDLRHLKLYNLRSQFVNDFFQNKKGIVLDVGNLGQGAINVDVRTMVEANGGEYWGLDVNKNLADTLAFSHQLIGDLHHLPEIESNRFDYIYAGEIIEHTWRPDQMMAECWRILKPGGILILNTPNAYSFVQVLRAWIRKKDTLGYDHQRLTYHEAKDNFMNLREEKGELLTQPTHKIFFSPAMMRQLLNMQGFAIEEFVFIAKPRTWLQKIFNHLIPQASQYLGVLAQKKTLEEVFDFPQ